MNNKSFGIVCPVCGAGIFLTLDSHSRNGMHDEDARYIRWRNLEGACECGYEIFAEIEEEKITETFPDKC